MGQFWNIGRRALGLWALGALWLVACEAQTDGGAGMTAPPVAVPTPDAVGADAGDKQDTDVFPAPGDADVPQILDTGTDTDAATDPDPVPDTDTDTGPTDDVPPEPDVTYPDSVTISCTEDAQCVVSCGTGGFCDVEHEACRFETVEGCLIPDEAQEVLTCFEEASTHPDSACLFCNPRMQVGVWSGTVIRESFEQGQGWFWNVMEYVFPPTASWTSSEQRAASGVGSLYFGDPYELTYQTSQKAEAEVFSVPIQIPDGLDLTLSFSLWLETEELPGYDVLTVLLRLGNGTKLELWNSDAIGGTTDGLFLPVTLTVPPVAGQYVSVGFHFDTVDYMDNDYEGVYIDEVALVTGCCNDLGEDGGALDCDDGNPCTTDSCPAFGENCVYETIEGCCNSGGECDDGDVCTVGVCAEAGGGCSFEPIGECCHETADCNDSNPCTEDVCPGDGGVCLHIPICCADAADCDDGDGCTEATCTDGQCSYDFVCCLSNAECNDGDYCTTDVCVGGDCLHTVALLPGCCAPEITVETFDNGNPPGWAFDPLIGGVGWSVAQVSKSQSAPGVLYYGNPNSENFDNGSINQGTARTHWIALPADVEVTVEFDTYFEGESSFNYDKFWVQINGPGGKETIATKSDIEVAAWAHIKKDISHLAGEEIQLIFHFETIDNLVNGAFGMAVDNLMITTSCDAKVCSSSGDCDSSDKCMAGLCEDGGCFYVNGCCEDETECDDGSVCTQDLCVTALCKFDPIPNCCQTVSDCEDQNPCTVDFCSGFGGECSHEDVGGCCLQHADCNDGDTCTQNTCGDNVCTDTWICCASDAECDDSDDICTTDACIDSFCAFTQTGADGCCEPEPATWGFETPVEWITTQTTPPSPCGWQVISTNMAWQGSYVMYYGDPGAMNFDCGWNAGTVTSEEVTLLPGVDYSLNFSHYQDSESGTTYDKLWVTAVVNSQETTLWTKADMSTGAMNSWATYELDISGLAGQSFNLVWNFDSYDSVINDKLGVMLDGVSITSGCQPVSCSADSDCTDDVPVTTGTCSPTGCSWSL